MSGVQLSPDGKAAAVQIATGLGVNDLWIYDLARGLPTRFTFNPAVPKSAPVWPPDGTAIYFSSSPKGVPDLYRKATNGAGAEEVVLADAVPKIANSVSPDGKHLLYTRVDPATRNDLWVLTLGGGAKPEQRPILQTLFEESSAHFSPDGHWVVYQADESGQPQVYAAPFPGPGGKRQISANGGTKAQWRKDGREIFYVAPGGELMAAEVAARNGTLEVGKVQQLFDVSGGGDVTQGNPYDVSSDGQKFLVLDRGAASAKRPLTLLQNWTAALRK